MHEAKDSAEFSLSQSIEKRLEQYTLKHSQEVLLVKAQIDGDLDEVTVFKGYSSSLTRQTSFDPDVPVLPAGSVIIAIDRVKSPYNPAQPQVIQSGISWDDFVVLLEAEGL